MDFVSLGALVHRLDPGSVPFRKATSCAIHVSGGEFNCAANLADCFGLRTGIVTAMVDYPIGDLIAERVKAMGVTPFYKRFAHDGVRGPNMAAVYSDQGFGVRAPVRPGKVLSFHPGHRTTSHGIFVGTHGVGVVDDPRATGFVVGWVAQQEVETGVREIRDRKYLKCH